MALGIEKTAQVIVDTADCAIGTDAASLVLMGLKGFRDDYEEHILHHRCLGSLKNPVPCVALCPAGSTTAWAWPGVFTSSLLMTSLLS